MTSAERHISVLGREAVEWLAPHAGGIYIDATFGAGGYSRAILDVAGTKVIGIDRDRTAIAGGFDLVDRSEGRLVLVQDRFSNLATVCAAQGVDAVDGVVMDVGVSSMQLDQAERGFSFRFDGPLDMRMGQDGPTAADVVAKASETDLASIIYIYGEERNSRRIARAIVAARKEAPIATTRALAELVARVVRAKPNEIHPATRTFQALRIFVNEELDELHEALLGLGHARGVLGLLQPGVVVHPVVLDAEFFLLFDEGIVDLGLHQGHGVAVAGHVEHGQGATAVVGAAVVALGQVCAVGQSHAGFGAGALHAGEVDAGLSAVGQRLTAVRG